MRLGRQCGVQRCKPGGGRLSQSADHAGQSLCGGRPRRCAGAGVGARAGKAVGQDGYRGKQGWGWGCHRRQLRGAGQTRWLYLVAGHVGRACGDALDAADAVRRHQGFCLRGHRGQPAQYAGGAFIHAGVDLAGADRPGAQGTGQDQLRVGGPGQFAAPGRRAVPPAGQGRHHAYSV
ncbi:hypothetical protein D3C71_1679760 [compost metagenome]